ncbi:MAG: VOC family protein [Ruminococcaceae bacterium]|nr:VOC family protein [Oscillospiraceae bacterium]
MKLDYIHHIAIIASDYEKAKDFYVNKLELPVIRELYREVIGDWKIDLQLADGIELELFVKPNAPSRVNRPEALGLRHLAFAVQDVRAAANWLAAKGIECEPIRIDPVTNREMTFFFDPDGLPMELHG